MSLFLHLRFPKNILLAFYTPLINTWSQNDRKPAWKKLPESKDQIKELNFFRLKDLFCICKYIVRYVRQDVAWRRCGRSGFPIPQQDVSTPFPKSSHFNFNLFFLTSYFPFRDLKCHFLNLKSMLVLQNPLQCIKWVFLDSKKLWLCASQAHPHWQIQSLQKVRKDICTFSVTFPEKWQRHAGSGLFPSSALHFSFPASE